MTTVLVVDDDPDIRRVFQKVLENAGACVLEAENGNVALKLLASHAVDVVLTDMIMPEMEGIETIMAIRREQPTIRIVAISGGGSVSAHSHLDLARHLGADAVLTKPVDRNRLVETVLGSKGN